MRFASLVNASLSLSGDSAGIINTRQDTISRLGQASRTFELVLEPSALLNQFHQTLRAHLRPIALIATIRNCEQKRPVNARTRQILAQLFVTLQQNPELHILHIFLIILAPATRRFEFFATAPTSATDVVLTVGFGRCVRLDQQVRADGAAEALTKVRHQSVQVRPRVRFLQVGLQHQPTSRHVQARRVHFDFASADPTRFPQRPLSFKNTIFVSCTAPMNCNHPPTQTKQRYQRPSLIRRPIIYERCETDLKLPRRFARGAAAAQLNLT